MHLLPSRHPVLHAVLALAVLLPTSVGTPAAARPATGERPARVLVGLADGAVRSMSAVPGVASLRASARTGVTVLDLEPGQSASQVAERLAARPDVRWAEPDRRVWAQDLTDLVDDAHASHLWGLDNVGQTVGSFLGVPGVDVDVEGAWAHTRGTRDVVVAVVDTGVDVAHPDLAANIWRNPGEVGGNGIDDDGNGLVDDVTGWDFRGDDATVFDDASADRHGTHVAGTIAAVGDNGRGVVGVAPGVRVMPLKFMGPDGSGWTSDAVAALEYADRMGADVVNLSWGGPDHSRALDEAIGALDAVVVAAAGNEGIDVDASPVYPAALAHDTLVSVAAVDPRGRLASFSNRGDATVDLGAPGVGILSTVPGGYAWMHGTSMAAPHVAGVAALARAAAPGADARTVVDALVSTTAPLASLSSTTRSGGLVDAGAAVARLLARSPVPTDPDRSTEDPAESSPDPTSESSPEPSPAPAPIPAPTPEPTRDPVRSPSVTRLAGADRYATAAAITRLAFAGPVDEVVLATGTAFADALSGAAAAAERGAPVLLVSPTALPAVVRDELVRLSPRRVTVLGGRAAVSDTVVRQVADLTGARVRRLAGTDRYTTSAAVSSATFAPGVPVAYLATGTSFPDALAAGAAAGRLGGPVLLTDPGTLPDAVHAELRRLDPGRVVVLGGPSAVSDTVRRAAGRAADAPTARIGGRSRYETAAGVVADAFPGQVDTVLLATGEGFPDALGGGAAAAVLGAAVLLVPPTGPLPDLTADQLSRLSPGRVLVLGGTGALSRETLDRVTARLG